MSVQFSVATRNARLDAIEATAGTATVLRVRTGSPPANCAAARSGTVLATANLPADWLGNASNGTKALSGTWTDASADATGTAGHFEIMDTALTTCHIQGTCGAATIIATSAATAANGNVLTFASTSGIVAGMNVSGTGVPTLATVAAVTATTVTLSLTSTAGVASGASITFALDLIVDNASFAAGQQFNVTAFSMTDGNA